ncbi:hypothetical protein [Microbulbifer celer]|uniref:hypothetical protein n=1 Tax=Microbulbifer celer TaxID=435905 RepID=UPI001F4B6AF4|nr:hypothetical protein [Microbulbifer celer]
MTKALRDQCENECVAQDCFGINVTEVLKKRLADIRSATTVFDLLVGKPRPILENGDELFVLELADQYLIKFSANHVSNPRLVNDQIDWSKIYRIKILGIEK